MGSEAQTPSGPGQALVNYIAEVAGGGFEPPGRHNLRGVGEAMDVHAPADSSSARGTAAE